MIGSNEINCVADVIIKTIVNKKNTSSLKGGKLIVFNLNVLLID